MRIYVSSSRQKIAVGTVALAVGLCVFDYRNDFDMPHLHIDDPVIPMTVGAVYAPATNTTNAIPPSWTSVREG